MTLLDTAAAAEELSARANSYFEKNQATRKRDRIEFYLTLSVLVFICATVSYWSQQHIEKTLTQPLSPLVHLGIASTVDNPILCPGDTLQYLVSRNVTDFFAGRVVVVVKNMDTSRQEISDGVDVIWDANQATLSSNWQIPLMLPATLTKPERAWRAGQYEREIAVTSYGANYKIEPAVIKFQISGNCAGVEK